MAAKESPLSELAATDGVRMVCVYGPEGRLLSCLPSAKEDSPWMEFFELWSAHPCLDRPELKEAAVFYPNSLVLWRRIDETRNPSEGQSDLGKASYRNLFLVAEPGASLSLLRVSLDVKEHGWRALGIQRVFPSSGGKGSEGGGILSKLFRRPSR